MKLLPAILPTFRHRLGAHAGEHAAELSFVAALRVHDELGAAALDALLEARRALEEPRARDLEIVGRDGERDALEVAQRSALEPAGNLRPRPARVSVGAGLVSSSTRRRCSSSRAVGTATSRRT